MNTGNTSGNCQGKKIHDREVPTKKESFITPMTRAEAIEKWRVDIPQLAEIAAKAGNKARETVRLAELKDGCSSTALVAEAFESAFGHLLRTYLSNFYSSSEGGQGIDT